VPLDVGAIGDIVVRLRADASEVKAAVQDGANGVDVLRQAAVRATRQVGDFAGAVRRAAEALAGLRQAETFGAVARQAAAGVAGVERFRGAVQGAAAGLAAVAESDPFARAARQAAAAVAEIQRFAAAAQGAAAQLAAIPQAARFEGLAANLQRALAGIADPARLEAVRARFEGLFASLADPAQLKNIGANIRQALAGVGEAAQREGLARQFERVFAGLKTPEQVRQLGEAVTGTFQTATREIGRAGDAAARFGRAGEAASASYGGLAGTFRTLAGLAAVVFAVRQVREWVGAGAQFNAQIEQMVLGMRAVLATNLEVTDQFGRQVEGAQKLGIAGEQVSLQMEKLKRDALLTTATLQQLIETMQVAIGPGSAVGLSVDQIRQVVVALSQMAAAIGLPLVQIPIEIREILEGTIQYRTRIAQVLNIQNEQVNNWKAQGTLFQELIKRTASFQVAGQQAGETWIGILSTLRDFKEQLAGAALAPAMDLIRRAFVAIRDSLGEARGGIFVFNESVVQVRDSIGRFATGAVQGFLEFLQRIRPVAPALLELAAVLGDAVRIAGSLAASLGVLAANLVAAYNEWLKWTGIPAILEAAGNALDRLRKRARGEALTGVEAAQRDAEAAAEAGRAAEARQRLLVAEVSGLKDVRAVLTDTTAAREDQAKAVSALAQQYPELRRFLNTEATQTREVAAAIDQMTAAREGDIERTREQRVAAVQEQIDAQRRILALAAQRRAEIEPGLPDPAKMREAAAFAEKLSAGAGKLIEARAEEAAQLRRAETAAIDALIEKDRELRTLVGKPVIEPRLRAETPDELKRRLALETEGRKGAAQALLKIQEDAEAELSKRRAEFEAREGATIEERLRFERAALAEKQRIERAKLQIAIDALRAESEAIQRTEDQRQQAALGTAARIEDQARRAREAGRVTEAAELERKANEAKVLAARQAAPELVRVEREIQDKRADLARLALRQEEEAIRQRTALRDKERQEEDDLFEFRRKLGEIGLLQEIDRQQRIAREAEEGSKRQRDALVAVRDTEKRLQQERESAALGEIGKLQERLKLGPLGRFTAETKFTQDTLAEALESLRAEQREALARAQTRFQGEGLRLDQAAKVTPGVGLEVGGVRGLVEGIKETREAGERARQVGSIRDIIAGVVRLPEALVPELHDLRAAVVAGLIKVEDAVLELVRMAGGRVPERRPEAAPTPGGEVPRPAPAGETPRPAPAAARPAAAPPAPVDLAAEEERIRRGVAAGAFTERQAQGLLDLARQRAAQAAAAPPVRPAPQVPPPEIPEPPEAAPRPARRLSPAEEDFLRQQGFPAEPSAQEPAREPAPALPQPPREITPPLPRLRLSPAEEEFLREQTGPPQRAVEDAGRLIPSGAQAEALTEPIAAGFEALPARAQEAMAKVAQIVGDTTEKLLADAQRFEGAFPRELFEGFYGQFVDTMKTEMRRAGVAV